MSELLLSADCPKIDGFLRSCIYDLTRQNYYLGKKFNSIRDLKKDFLAFLIKNEVVIKVPTCNLSNFLKIRFTHNDFSVLSSCHFEGVSTADFDKILSLGCHDFALELTNFSTDKELLLSKLNGLKNSPINSLELHIYGPSVELKDVEVLNNIYREYCFVKIIMYARAHDAILRVFEKKSEVNFIFKKLEHFKSYSHMRENFFLSMQLFLETKSCNPFFYKKIFISKNGLIKNSYRCENSFGRLSKIKSAQDLVKIVKSFEFQKYWYVHKGLIDVCNQCEFRRMCVDSRVPVQRKDNTWYYESECDYNPFIAKWKDEKEYKALEACGITITAQGSKINYSQLRAVIRAR